MQFDLAYRQYLYPDLNKSWFGIKKRNTEYLTECVFNVKLQKPLISLLSLYPVDYSGFLQNQNLKKKTSSWFIFSLRIFCHSGENSWGFKWNLEKRELLMRDFIKFGTTNHTEWHFSDFSTGSPSKQWQQSPVSTEVIWRTEFLISNPQFEWQS